MRWDYILVGLGILLLTMGFFPTAKNYLPELEEWNWAMTVHLSGSSEFPVLAKFKLPAEVNDLSSLRVTVLSGEEHMVGFYLDDKNHIYVPVELPADVRLYWGRGGALPVYQDYDGSVFNLRKRDDFSIEHEGGAWSYPRFIGSYIRLISWDSTARGRLQYARAFPGYPVAESALIRSSGWGRAYLFLPLDDENYPLELFDGNEDNLPSSLDGVLIYTNARGLMNVRIVRSGEVVKSFTSRGSLRIAVLRYGYDVGVRIGTNLVYRGTVDRPLEKPALYYGSYGRRSDYFDVWFWKVSPLVKGVRVHASPVYMAPKRPVIELLSPDKVVPDSSVDVSVRVSDPNGDLNVLRLYIDGNLLLETNEYGADTVVELNDGFHTLRAYARDLDGAESSLLFRFVVDTRPPEVNVSYETNDGNVVFSVSVSDLTDVSCRYVFDGEEYPFDCSRLRVSLQGCGDHELTISVCDEADHCTSHTYVLGKPCNQPVAYRTVLREMVVERPVVKFVKAEEVSRSNLAQPASPVSVSGPSVVVALAVIVFFLMRVL